MLNVLNYFHTNTSKGNGHLCCSKCNVATTLEVIHIACVCIVISLDSIALGRCVFRLTVSNHPKNPLIFHHEKEEHDVVTWGGTRWSLIAHVTFCEV